MDAMEMNVWSLVAAFSLVLIAVFLSHREKLGLEKDVLLAVARMVVQLIAVGFILTYVFKWDEIWITLVVVLIMDFNAAWNAYKHGRHIPGAFRISSIAVLVSSGIAMAILLGTGSIQFIPRHVIPINGMMIGNAMVIIGLSFNNLTSSMASQQKQITEKLALGASQKEASMDVIRDSIKISIQPTVDSTKTVGLVSLPGMMTGMIFAGTLPMSAIMYQIMIFFMLMAVATMCAVMVSYMAYSAFFTDRGQLNHGLISS